jgi:hypothetical protein
VLHGAEQLQQAKLELATLTARLSAGTQLLLMLMRLKFKLDDADAEVLKNVFNPRHREQHSQGAPCLCTLSALLLAVHSLSRSVL